MVNTKKIRSKGATRFDKVKVFRAVGLRPKNGPLNEKSVNNLEFIFQIATVSPTTWDILLQLFRMLRDKKKQPSMTTFKSFQGCTDRMKQDLINGVLSGSFQMKDLKGKAESAKLVEKVKSTNYFNCYRNSYQSYQFKLIMNF